MQWLGIRLASYLIPGHQNILWLSHKFGLGSKAKCLLKSISCLKWVGRGILFRPRCWSIWVWYSIHTDIEASELDASFDEADFVISSISSWSYTQYLSYHSKLQLVVSIKCLRLMCQARRLFLSFSNLLIMFFSVIHQYLDSRLPLGS